MRSFTQAQTGWCVKGDSWVPEAPFECDGHNNGLCWNGACLTVDDINMGCTKMNVGPGFDMAMADKNTWMPISDCHLWVDSFSLKPTSKGQSPIVNVKGQNCFHAPTFIQTEFRTKYLKAAPVNPRIQLSQITGCKGAISDNLQIPCELSVTSYESQPYAVSFASPTSDIFILEHSYVIKNGNNPITIYIESNTNVSTFQACVKEYPDTCTTYKGAIISSVRGRIGRADYDGYDLYQKHFASSTPDIFLSLIQKWWVWLGIVLGVIAIILIAYVAIRCSCWVATVAIPRTKSQ
jgi:hypothetical protein